MAYAVVEAKVRLVGDYCHEIGCRTVKLQIILDRIGYEQECGIDMEIRVDLDNNATMAEIQQAAFTEACAVLEAASAATLLYASQRSPERGSL